METITVNENVLEKLSSEPKNWWKRLLIFLIVLGVVIWGSSSISFSGLTQRGAMIARSVFRGMFHPDTEFLFDLSSNGAIALVFQTIAIAILGTLFGALIAIPVSFLSATNIVPKPTAYLFRAMVLLMRTIPSLIWALIWIRVTGPGAFCGVVTQSICSIGMITKMYITAIENLDTGILESLDACGCNTFEKIRVGVLPQLSASFISTAIYRFDINLKDASTLGIVGAGGIGSPLVNAITNGRWPRVGAILLILIVLVVLIEWISTKIRARLAHGRS